jgi:spore coat protein CotH
MKKSTLALLLPFLIACVPSSSFSESLPSSSQWTTLESEPEYVTFWQPIQKSISLIMQPETLQWIETYGAEKNSPTNEYYFPITLVVMMQETTYTLENVGIRQKGNIFSRGTFLNEDGELVYPFHFRLSFDQTFDDPFYDELGIRKPWQNGQPEYEAQQKRRLFGMKSLEFKWNRSYDRSLINQPFASTLFTASDVIAPQSTLSPISIHVGETTLPLGMYIINEAVDHIFIQRHFAGPHAEGDLYKALYPNTLLLDEMAHFDSSIGDYVFHEWMVGIENNQEGYHPVYDLKTNQETSSHEALMKLVKTFKSLRLYNDQDRLDRLSSVLDIPAFIRYVSTSFLVGNPDDMRNNQNNSYIYFDGVTQQATIIPYDNDWSLGVTWDESLTQWTATKSPFESVNSFSQPIQNPLFWVTVIPSDGSLSSQLYPLVPSIYDMYVESLIELSESLYFTETGYQSLFDSYRLLYEDVYVEITLPNPSRFESIDAFLYHAHYIQATLTSLSTT